MIWGCVDTLNKTIAAIPNKQFILNRLRVLPILTDMLEISSQLSTTECILKMLHDVTFGAEITVVEPFLEKLLQIIVDIIVGQNSMRIISDAKPQHNDVNSRPLTFRAADEYIVSESVLIDISGREKSRTSGTDQCLLQ